MTNREACINILNNKELALVLNSICKIEDNKLKIFKEEVGCQEIKKIETWLSQEAEETADEMFEKLGWTKILDNTREVIYVPIPGLVEIDFYGYDCEEISISKLNFSFAVKLKKDYYSISPKLDKAIHKKIEELKGEY